MREALGSIRVRLASLRVRLPLLGMAILAISLGLSTALAYQLTANVGLGDLDLQLRGEQSRFERSVASALDAAGAPADPAAAEAIVRQAAQEYLRLIPAGAEYLSIVRIGDEVLAAPDGPAELRSSFARDELPASAPGRVQTISTPAGEIRSLVSPITSGEREVAVFQVAAPVRPLSAATAESLRRMAVLSGISLILGGLLLALVLYRALAPLRELASTARSIQLGDLRARVAEPARMDEVGQLAREFNGMLARLDRAAEDQREFMATVSHELRTPVTIARGHIETLERAAARDPGAVGQHSAVVREELQRISRLVEDLMALARSEMDDFVVTAPMRVDRFFDDLELRLTGLGTANVELRRPAPIEMVGDADRLAQALLNLIVNASVHTPPGTAIVVSARREGSNVVFSVHDDGPGIDPAIRNDLFRPFVRGSASGSRVQRSTGLGLAVVAAVVDAHRGTVDIDTGPHGTTIELRIPLGTATPAGSPAADDETEAVPVTPTPPIRFARPAPKRPRA